MVVWKPAEDDDISLWDEWCEKERARGREWELWELSRGAHGSPFVVFPALHRGEVRRQDLGYVSRSGLADSLSFTRAGQQIRRRADRVSLLARDLTSHPLPQL